MSTPRHDSDDPRIDAYLDGELPASEAAEIERAAAADPVFAERLARDRALLLALRHAHAGILDDPIPARLIRTVAPRPWSWWRRAAAAAACIVLGASLGWQASHWSAPARLAEARPVSVEAAAAHAVYLPEVRHPVEVDSSQRDHLDRWLSKRLAHELVSPDLLEFGFNLVGGRLLPDAGRPAAQYMYQNADGERITIYARGEPRARTATPSRIVEDQGFRVVHWEADQMAYAVTGRLDKARLEQLAQAVRERI